MAQFDASVVVNVVTKGEQRLNRIRASVNEINRLSQNLKPLNLLAPGSGKLGDSIRQALKPIKDFAREAVNGTQRYSNTLSGATGQAQIFKTVLDNVKIAAGGYDKQIGEVKTLATAYAQAAQQATELSERQRDLLTDARERAGIRPKGQSTLLGSDEAFQARAAYDSRVIQEREITAQKKEQLRLNKLADKLEASLLAKERLRARQSRFRENLALGAGFPLLFGGGIGSVAGGIAGSFSEDGFGLQILLSAIGQAFDEVTRKAGEFGKALRDGADITRTYEAALGKLDKKTKTFIDNLEKSGQLERARQVAFDQLEEDLGGVASAYRKAAEEADVFKQVQEKIGRFFSVLATPQPTEFSPLTNGPVTAPPPQQDALTKAAERANKLAEDKLAIERLITKEQIVREQGLSVNSSQRIADVERELANSRAQLEIDKVRQEASDGLLTKKQEQAKIDAILEERSRKLLDIETQRLDRNEEIARAIGKAVDQRLREEAALNVRDTEAFLKTRQLIAKSYQAEAQALLQITRFRQGNATALALELQILGGVEQAQRNILAVENAKLASSLAGIVPEEQINQIIQQRKNALELILKLRREEVKRAAQLLELERQLAVPRAVGELQDRSRQAGQGLEEARIRARGGAGERALDDAREILEIQERLAALNGQATIDEAIAEKNRLKALEDMKYMEEQLFSLANTAGTLVKDAMETALVDTIAAAIQGTDDLNEKLKMTASTLLTMLGKAFVNAGINMAAGTDGQGFFSFLNGSLRADGGPVDNATPYIVGERGPELFVPNTSGRVVASEQSRAQLDMYSPGNAVDAPAGPMNVNMNYSGPTMAFDDKRYLPIEAVPSIIKDAAKQGEQRALSSMRNKVSTRNRVGI